MEGSTGRPATQIEVEAMTAIVKLQDENLKLRQEVERLQAYCNALIDALRQSDFASYYPHLTDREGVEE